MLPSADMIFADHRHRPAARQPHQLDGGLGVAGPRMHAARIADDREHVAGSGEIVCLGGGGGERHDGGGARSAAEMPVVVPCR